MTCASPIAVNVPTGLTYVVNFTGGTLYTTTALTAAVSFPQTITAGATLYYSQGPGSTSYTFSCLFNGVELAGTSVITNGQTFGVAVAPIPTAAQVAAAESGQELPLTGGTMSGAIAMGSNKITGLANGSAAQDAAAFGQIPTNINPPGQFGDLLGWSFDPLMAQWALGGQNAASLFLFRVPLLATTTITNVLIYMNGLGDTLTNSFVAVYTSAGTVVGQSADQSTPWGTGGSTGLKTIPLVGGPFAVTPLSSNDFVWAGFYVGTGTTRPNFNGGGYGAPGDLYYVGTTLARSRSKYYSIANIGTLPSVTPSAGTAWGNLGWVGIS
jgi:hypothetical protein